MRQTPNPSALGRVSGALATVQNWYYHLAKIQQPRRLMSVQDALSGFPGVEVFRTPSPDISFAKVADIDAPSPGADVSSPAYDAYLACFENAVVHGGSNFILGPNGEAVNDVATDPKYGRWTAYNHEPLLKKREGDTGVFLRQTPTRTIERAFHLSGYFSKHFGHWIGEYLPRLRHLERLPGWEDVPILVNDDMPASHYEALALLTQNPVIRIARNATWQIRNLYVAPTINFHAPDYRPGYDIPVEHRAAWSAEAMSYVRDRILAQSFSSKVDASRIFISRRNSVWARPLNEADVEAVFEGLGFRIIQPETMNFHEQVETMRSARFIVGPSGSAFNMAMFARSETPILVLAQGAPHNWGGWLGPMRQLGFDVRFMLSESGSDTEKLMSYTVNIERIPGIVSRLLEAAE